MNDLINCPCGRGIYAQCCKPLHQGLERAKDAEQLMRSRYSAFALQHIEYLIETTAKGQQKYLDQDAIKAWSQQNQWLKLEVIGHLPKLDKSHAQVEFKAYYRDGVQEQIHHEVSHFVLFEHAWYFLDPTLDMQVTMKQACICGSTKKFKQCCAQFI